MPMKTLSKPMKTRRYNRACQTQERVGDEGTHRCCQYRACEEQDQQKQLHAMSERRLQRRTLRRLRCADRRSADAGRGCRSRRVGVVEDEARTIATKSCWTKT